MVAFIAGIGTVVSLFLFLLSIWIYRRIWSRSVSKLFIGLQLRDIRSQHKDLLRFRMVGQVNGFGIEVGESVPATVLKLLFQLMDRSPVTTVSIRSLSIDLDGRGRIPPEIELSPAAANEAEGVVTEELTFDQTVLATGPEATMLALLDHDTRDAVLALIKQEGVVSRSLIRTTASSMRKLTKLIPKLSVLAGKLSMSRREIPRRLAENALKDRSPKVRARNFVALQQHFAGTEDAEQTVERALAAGDPYLCLEVAFLRQDPELLRELATTGENPVLIRVRAVEGLTRASWAEAAIPVLEQLVSDDMLLLRQAAIIGLGRFRHRPAVAQLIELAADKDKMRGLAGIIAEALGRIGDAAAEPTLLELLKYPADDVVEAAVRALARAGTISAVEPLLEHAQSLRHDTARTKVKETVRRIQSRLAGAERGQLSIASAPEPDGALSLAGESIEGSVSLVTEEGSGTTDS